MNKKLNLITTIAFQIYYPLSMSRMVMEKLIILMMMIAPTESLKFDKKANYSLERGVCFYLEEAKIRIFAWLKKNK